jgi:serine/threonine protein kinase/WD40 repeat protein
MVQGLRLAQAIAPSNEGPLTELLPRELGEYELLEQIARGGMGVIYRARQRDLDRIVAVKLLLLGPRASPDFVKRFRAEASAAASLHHPNIVAIHQVGVHQGEHYLAMDLVDGPDLAKFIKDQPLPARRAAGYLKTIAEAIHYAHERGILHRDLKPSNVLIDSNDQPRVTDFGLAKRFDGDSSLTLSGQVLGSPSYMPPEQAGTTRHKVGRRSDVYSLGAMLYHMLVGRPPFVGESLNQTLDQVLNHEPISPRLLNPAVPHDLETICLKCLEKEPARRFQTARALADELGRFLRDEPIRARPVSRPERLSRWCRRKPVLAGLIAALHLALIFGAAGVLWQWHRARRLAVSEAQLRQRAEADAFQLRQNSYAADMSVAQRAIEEGDLGPARVLLKAHIPTAQQTDLRGFEWRYFWGRAAGDEVTNIGESGVYNIHLCLSPDDSLLAFAGNIWNVPTGKALQPVLTNETALAFAPRGNVLLFNDASYNFMRLDLASGEKSLLAERENVAAVAFSATGHWMATGRFVNDDPTPAGGNLSLWDTTTWQRVASVTNLSFDDGLPQAIAFSPDETILVAATGHSLAGFGQLRCFRVPSLEPMVMPPNAAAHESCVVFAPNGHEFFTGDWNGDVRAWDARTLRELEERRRPGLHRTWIGAMAFLPGTTNLLSVGGDRCLHIWEPYGHAPIVTLRGHTREIEGLAITRDGRTAYTVSSGTIKQWAPLATRHSDTLPVTGSSIHLAGLSADSQTMAVISDGALVLTKLANENQVAAETRPGITGLPTFQNPIGFSSGTAVVSPDLAWLAVARANSPLELCDIARHTRQAFGEPLGALIHASFSPDSRLLAFQRGTNTVLLEVSSRRELASIPGWADWSPPFMFAAQTNLLSIARHRRVLLWDTGLQRQIKEVVVTHPSPPVSFALSANGQQLAIGYTDDTFTLHDTRTGLQLGEPVPAHLSGVLLLCFSTDGRTLVSTTQRSLKFWNLATRRELAAFDFPGMLTALAFTPDGNNLVAGTDGLFYIWRALPLSQIAQSPSAK